MQYWAEQSGKHSLSQSKSQDLESAKHQADYMDAVEGMGGAAVDADSGQI